MPLASKHVSTKSVDNKPDIQAQITKLTQEENELASKLSELRKERDYLARQHQEQIKYLNDWDTAIVEDNERTLGIEVKLEEITGDIEKDSPIDVRLSFSGPKNDILLSQLWHQLKGRYFDYTKVRNTIPLESYPQFKQIVDDLNKVGKTKVNLQFANGTKELVEGYLSRPRVSISLSPDKKNLILKAPKGENFLISTIQGVKVNYKHNFYTLAVNESFKALEALEKEEGVKWDDDALKVANEQVESRRQLDKIALAEDISDKDLTGLHLHGLVLRPFQKVGIKFGEATGFRFLLGDQMGLGKTVQAIGCAQLLEHKLGRKPNVFVICPANLRVNWVREINKLTRERVYVLMGREPSKYDIELLLLKKYNWHVINYDILGSKTETYDEHEKADGTKFRSNVRDRYVWQEFINMVEPDLIILDEAHYIKNTDANRSKAARELKANHIICMTGTPVLNRPGELWPALTLLHPERFPSYEGFLSTYTYNGREARNITELRNSLKNIMLRRTKKEVMKDLPPINRVYEWHELSEIAKKNYNEVLKGVYNVLAEWEPSAAGSQQEITGILVQIQRLKQVCAIDKVNTVSDLAVQLSDDDVDANGSGKVLIFSQYVPVVTGIHKRLGHESIAYHGGLNRHERQSLIDEFLSNKTKKFFVATWQTAGEGLNLQIANNVIFADLFWTPANHQQCEERAYGRLADPHPINSYYVVTEGTIEDWIQEILDRKLKVIEQVVEGLDTERSVNIAGELLRKMKQQMRGLK